MAESGCEQSWRSMTDGEKIEALRAACAGLSKMVVLMKEVVEGITGNRLIAEVPTTAEQEAAQEQANEDGDFPVDGAAATGGSRPKLCLDCNEPYVKNVAHVCKAVQVNDVTTEEVGPEIAEAAEGVAQTAKEILAKPDTCPKEEVDDECTECVDLNICKKPIAGAPDPSALTQDGCDDMGEQVLDDDPVPTAELTPENDIFGD